MAAKKQAESVEPKITGYIITRFRGDKGLGEITIATGQEGGLSGIELVDEASDQNIFIPEDSIALAIDRMQVLQQKLQGRAKGQEL